MQNVIHLTIQLVMSVSAYTLLYRIYLRPWLQTKAFEQAVLPFLILHIFRFLGLNLLVTGQVDPAVPREALQIMAYGDLASGICALLATLAIVTHSGLKRPLVWLFSMVGIADFFVIGPTAWNAGVLFHSIGTMWFLMSTFAPVLALTHIYILSRLLSKSAPHGEITSEFL